MKFVSKQETIIRNNSDRCVATEYPVGDKDIDFATVEISERYPDEGRVMNRTSKEICWGAVSCTPPWNKEQHQKIK